MFSSSSLLLLLTIIYSSHLVSGDCSDGWSSCDSSIWVHPKIAPDNPLTWSYTPGEIRGPLEYEIKFSCRGRRNGYYADLDHGCKVWHYCNTTREINPINGLSTWTYMHFSYACLEQGQRYDQVLKECVYENKALVRCVDSELYYPSGDNPNDVPITINANNRLVPVRCPQVTPVKCSIQNDHIALKGCPEAPGAVVSFYATLPSVNATSIPPSYFADPSDIATESPDVDETEPPKYNPSPVIAPAVVSIPDRPPPGNNFRFRETPELAARKSIARGQSAPSGAPPPPVKSTFVVQSYGKTNSAKKPAVQRVIHVYDVSQQQDVPQDDISQQQYIQSPPQQEIKGKKESPPKTNPPPPQIKGRRPPPTPPSKAAPPPAKRPPPPSPTQQPQEVKGRKQGTNGGIKGQQQQQQEIKGGRKTADYGRPPRISRPPNRPRTVFYPNVEEIGGGQSGQVQPNYRVSSAHSASSQVIFPRRLSSPFEVHVRTPSAAIEGPPSPISSIISTSSSGSASTSGESVEADFLGLPIGSTKILGDKIDTSFDCTGKTYGYYADVKNECKVYHVCSPKVDEFGVKFYEHFSFICAEGLVFDQQKLTCVPSREAISCHESEKFFKRTAAKFHEEHESFLNRHKTTSGSAISAGPVSGSVPPTTNVIVGRSIQDVSQPITVVRVSSVVPAVEPEIGIGSDVEPDVSSYSYSKTYSSKKSVPSGSSVYSSPARKIKTRPSQLQSQQKEEIDQQQSGQDEQQFDQPSKPPTIAIQEPPLDGYSEDQQRTGQQLSSDDAQQYEEKKPKGYSSDSGAVTNPRRRIVHSPRITQYSGQPSVGPVSRGISHNPSIIQVVGQPGVGPISRAIGHSPSISQYIGQPGVGSSSEIISHNPSIRQYIPGIGDQPVSGNDESISHNPTISHYVSGGGVPAGRRQVISHNPTIHQVILRPEYSRPSGRIEYWG